MNACKKTSLYSFSFYYMKLLSLPCRKVRYPFKEADRSASPART